MEAWMDYRFSGPAAGRLLENPMNASWQQANLASWNNRATLHMQDATGT
jgi:alpha-ketoglutarate-dependent taurine dioxygenase